MNLNDFRRSQTANRLNCTSTVLFIKEELIGILMPSFLNQNEGFANFLLVFFILIVVWPAHGQCGESLSSLTLSSILSEKEDAPPQLPQSLSKKILEYEEFLSNVLTAPHMFNDESYTQKLGMT